MFKEDGSGLLHIRTREARRTYSNNPGEKGASLASGSERERRLGSNSSVWVWKVEKDWIQGGVWERESQG